MKTGMKVAVLLMIAVIALLALTGASFAQSAANAPVIQSLAELVPTPEIPEAFHFSIDYLTDNRIFVVADRIRIIDLSEMKVVAESEIPEEVNGDWEKFALFQRVQPLESGVAWLVQKVPMGSSETVPDCFYFQFDDELNLVRESKLSDALPPEAASPHSFDPTRDGSALIYLGYRPDETDISLLNGEFPLKPDSDKILYKTEKNNAEAFSWITNIHLMNNGKTVFFVGGRFNLDDPSSPPKYVYAAIGADGNGLKVLDPDTIAESYPFHQVTDSHGKFPQTSPIALLIPEDPFINYPENPDDFVYTVPPVKSAYAWNVESGDVSEIPFNVPLEDGNAVLSENGAFLGTATADDPLTEINSFTVRLYDTATGELLLTQQYPDLVQGGILKLRVSEAEKAMKIIYRHDDEYFFSEIPFEP